MSKFIKDTRRVRSGAGVPGSLVTTVDILKNNEYKITYFTTVSSTAGTITIPANATILLDQFAGGVDAFVSTIINGQPTGTFPQTAGGVNVDVTSFDALGNFTLSGTPSSYPVALVYILKISALNYSNLTIGNILDLEDIGAENIANKATSFGTLNNILYPTTQAVANYVTSFGYGTGTIKGSVAATVGLIPYGTGVLDTITTTAALSYNGTTFNIGTQSIPANFAGSLINSQSISTFLPVFSGLNTNTTGAAILVLGESNANLALFGKYGSTYPGSWAGTSVAVANNFGIFAGAQPTLPMTLGGSPIIHLVGVTSTTLGIRHDTTGVRIGALSTLHTSNTVAFQVGSNLTYDETNKRLKIGSATPAFNAGFIDMDTGNSFGFYTERTSATGFGGIGARGGTNLFQIYANGQSVAGNFQTSTVPNASLCQFVAGNYNNPFSLHGSGMYFFTSLSASTYAASITSGGALFGLIENMGTVATAKVHIAAGTTSAGKAPLKFTSGSVMTTPEAGTIEYNNAFYGTKNSGLRFALGGTIFTSTTTAGNTTTTETDLFSYTTPASTLEANNGQFSGNSFGTFVASGTATRQLRVYFAGTLIYDSAALSVSTSADWSINFVIIRKSATEVNCTVNLQTTGASGANYSKTSVLTGLTLSNTNIFKITGQAGGVGAATNDIILYGVTGRWDGPPNN